MRKVLVIGIGTGNPEHITVQAIKALNRVDVFFFIDKGEEKDELLHVRREICARYIENKCYRTVVAPDPPRDRNPPSYQSAVEAWHEERAALYERLIREELDQNQRGAFLVWGDPSLYDSTLRILERVLARNAVGFEYEVIPGITSIQALTASHRIPLNQLGGSVCVTTARQLTAGLPDDMDSVVVMLDSGCSFKRVADEALDIFWGAYLGTKDEILVSGHLPEVMDEIERIRREARERHGWIMDTYLLRRPQPVHDRAKETSMTSRK